LAAVTVALLLVMVLGRNNSTWAMLSEVHGNALRGIGRCFRVGSSLAVLASWPLSLDEEDATMVIT